MGTKCQRKNNTFYCHKITLLVSQKKIISGPCQDNYLSCASWQEEDKCIQMRPATKFYDINCAATCGQCVFVNSTSEKFLNHKNLCQSETFCVLL